jgi:hypothetical protein
MADILTDTTNASPIVVEGNPESPTIEGLPQVLTPSGEMVPVVEISGVGSNGASVRQGSTAQTYQVKLDNPLHEYDSYTYGISLHLLTEREYNNLVTNPYNTYIPQNVLVASAGKYSSTFRRNPYFAEDFFFDDLKITTVVNTTVRNRNSNLISCSFTLVEPNGFTFINRLLDAVQSANGKNYLRQPYMLQIDFYGYKDGVDQAGPIEGQSKYLPITFVTMRSRVTSRGTEYQIEAVPYNHIALNPQHAVTPAAFQVKAKTVADLLGNGQISNPLVDAFSASQQNAQREQDKRERLQAAIATGALDPRDAEEAKQYLAKPASLSGQFQVSGLTDAINNWFQSLQTKNKTILVPNTYRVVFDKEIGNAEIFPSNSANDISNVAGGGSTNQSASANIKAAGGIAVGLIDWKSGVFNIKMGTPIDKVIDYAVRNSGYIRNQLADPTSNTGNDLSQIQTKLGNPLRWFKIVPSVTIGAYDPSRDQYSYVITYYVKPWTVNTKHPYAPQGRANGYSKMYNYIFTGQNKEVIDCQIDFDMLYYTQLVAFRNKLRTTETGNTDLPATGADTPAGPGVNIVQKDRLTPVPVNYIANDQKLQNRTGADQASAVSGGDIQKDITLNSRGDMINIKLRIIGDPHFIKQDDVFYGQTSANSVGALTPNGSLYFDNGELYVYVVFQSPVDYDETTGLAIPTGTTSEFTGIYKVITVDNTFSRGKFEQTLDLVRLPISDQLRNQVTNAKARVDSYVNYGLGQLAALPYARFTGPRILVNSLAQGGPVYNAALAGSNGTLGGIASKLVSQGINQLVGKATGAVSGMISKGISSIGSAIGDKFASLKYDTIGPSAADMASADQADAFYNGTGSTVWADYDVGAEALPTDSLDTAAFDVDLVDVPMADMSIGDDIDVSNWG